MTRLNDDVGVALVKEICPICGKEVDGPILIGNTFNKKHATQINNLNGKPIGFAKEPCPECKSWIDKGCFFIIGIDVSKTDDMRNPYRSGHIVGIKRESEFYKNLDPGFKKHDAVYMDYLEMERIGLIQSV